MSEKKPLGQMPFFKSTRLNVAVVGAGQGGVHGERTRKTYKPNFNVQRNKSKETNVGKVEHSSETSKRGRGQGRRSDRGRGTSNLVQLTGGVFAEGCAAAIKKSSYSAGGSSGASDANFVQMPKLNIERNRQVDKEVEDMKLQELLRDDFVNDPGYYPDEANKPIQLPFVKDILIKEEENSETNVKEEIKVPDVKNTCIKEEMETEIRSIKTEFVVDGVKIKQEPTDDGEYNRNVKEIKIETDVDSSKQLNLSKTAELFKNTNNRQQIFFLQLPDTLPGLKPETNPPCSRPSTSKSSSDGAEKSSESSEEKNCTLGSLSEGYIGKLQVLKSGKVQLVLGNTVLHVDPSLQISYREDLVCVDLDTMKNTGDMINLGSVDARLLCTPHWEMMLPKDD